MRGGYAPALQAYASGISTIFGAGPVTISNAMVALFGSGANATTVTVTDVTIQGAGGLRLSNPNASYTTTLSGSDVIRNGRAQLVIESAALGGATPLRLTGSITNLINGIIAPWVMRTDSGASSPLRILDFVTYGDAGVTSAVYTTGFDAGTDFEVARVATTTLSANEKAYAFRTSGGASTAKTIDVNGNTLALGTNGLAGLIFSNIGDIIKDGGTGGKLDIGTNELVIGVFGTAGGDTATIGVPINGSGGLTMMGTTLAISNPAVYSGNITINGGTLFLWPTANAIFNNSIRGGAGTAVAGSIAGLIKHGPNSLTLSGSVVNVAGDLTVRGGALVMSNGWNYAGGVLNVSNSAVLRVAAGATCVVDSASTSYIGDGSTGTVEVTGGLLWITNGTTRFGRTGGFATLDISAGTLELGAQADSWGVDSGGFNVDVHGTGQILCKPGSGPSIGSATRVAAGKTRVFRIRDSGYVGPLYQPSLGSDTLMLLEGGLFTNTSAFYVGGGGVGTNSCVIQSGGVNASAQLSLSGVLDPSATNRYVLSNGIFRAATFYIHDNGGTAVGVGQAIFEQHGGTNQSGGGGFFINRSGLAATGTYYITDGVLDANAGNPYIAGWTSSKPYVGRGILKLGDADSSGVVTNVATLYLLKSGVTDLTAQAHATIQGWGTIHATTLNIPDVTCTGRYEVIADGWGNERTLSFAKAGMAVVNGMENTASNGWYAQNKGRLELPPLIITNKTGSYTTNWGESGSDTTIDLVNSMRLTFNTLSASGAVSVALLATNRTTEFTAPMLTQFLGVWEVKPLYGLALSGTLDMTVRYDDVARSQMGLLESDLKLYQYNGATWQPLTTTYPGSQRLSASVASLSSPYIFAAGKMGSLAPGSIISVR